MAGRPQGHPPRFQTVRIKERSAYSAPFFYAELISVDAPWEPRARNASGYMSGVCFAGSGRGSKKECARRGL